MLRSIRWRLAASYVLLTLLIVTLVGTATLWLVRVSVERQEIAFLTANANSVARQVLPLWEVSAVRSDASHPMLLQLVRTAAFLGNVRVKILDAERNVLVDSGDPTSLNEFAWFLTPASNGAAVAYTATWPDGTDWTHSLFALPFISTDPAHIQFQWRTPGAPAASPDSDSAVWNPEPSSPEMIEGAHDVVIIRTFPSQWGSRIEFEPQDFAESIATELRQVSIVSDSERLVPITRSAILPPTNADASQSAQPTVRESAAFAEIPRSTRKVEAPIGGLTKPLGYVELSNGPDYGSPLLDTIWKAFAIAAGSVSFLAVLIGLAVGRGLTAPLLSLTTAAERMSRGDLASRAAVQSHDEIGALARQFNQMAAQLESSFAELAAERDALRRFMADASHELRTPITALQTFLELLRGSAAADPRVQREFLQESQQQVSKLASVTGSLLELSRLEGGLGNLQRQPEDVGALVQRAAALFRLTAQEKQIEFDINLPESALAASCDAERVEAALTNLLDNAFKFAPVGGRVEIGVSRANEESIQFWVQDNGLGVSPTDAPHIFKRFYQGTGLFGEEKSSEWSTVPRGAGLGLAIVQSIVQAHGGHVRLETPAQGGSRFIMELPGHI